ncbi:probable serine/threonine-protein kinase PBL19 isoform X1 [Diospyros lotus]|uniref:probable serine/threonine-protein kinase PBL19 isoform X1 n=1 Tax=Diospyros lotus TaxID=55363 RepID=UPI00224D3F2F|nr:probable serine/threonine-protein kinase PBL19 isoform X1 [Diospyros lotus]
MNCCCFPFKDCSKSLEGKSPPELKNQNNEPEAPATNLVLNSADSVSLPPKSLTETFEEKQRDLRVFSFSELKIATNSFDKSLKIGEGGFGSVFKATVSPSHGQGDPIVVAIKRLDQHAFQGHKQWLAEVKYLSILNHPNLVKLIGYCSEDWERGLHCLLVYEYMPNKSLEDHLFSSTLAPLAWKRRLEIILGTAEGLAYLHGGFKVQVIHRDFKSSNVLLDENFKPKLSDFGIAREGPTGDRTHVSTDVVGTFGYSAPEYVETGHLTFKSDIYSFGVVLYEVLTGRRTVDRDRPPMEQRLVEWVQRYPADSNMFSRIIDRRLGNQYSLPTAQKIAKLADSCLKWSPKYRPTMTEVVESLKEAIQDSGGGRSSPEHPHPSWPPNGNHGNCFPVTSTK